MYLQPGRAGKYGIFNGALIRTLEHGRGGVGMGSCLPVANNARDHLLAKITVRLYM